MCGRSWHGRAPASRRPRAGDGTAPATSAGEPHRRTPHLPGHAGLTGIRWLLVRRTGEAQEDLTAYRVFATLKTTLAELARVAGRRWPVEIGFEEAKGEVGLDEYEVRRWDGWHRPIPLALVAHALLAAMRTQGQEQEAREKGDHAASGQSGGVQTAARALARLSVAEVRRLVRHRLRRLPSWEDVRHWSA